MIAGIVLLLIVLGIRYRYRIRYKGSLLNTLYSFICMFTGGIIGSFISYFLFGSSALTGRYAFQYILLLVVLFLSITSTVTL